MVESGAPIKVWGINNEYETLRDVLLGIPQFYRWVDSGPLTKRTLLNAEQLGARFDLQLAMAQHAEMVRAYESAGVTCHFLDSDEVLHRNFFARDSSAMTPWGALICHLQLKCRRADYVTAIRFYQNVDIPIWNMVSAGHFEGGDFCIIQPGSVLIGFGGPNAGIYVAVMHSGVTLAPLIGRLAADEIVGGTPSGLLAPYRPDRFN